MRPFPAFVAAALAASVALSLHAQAPPRKLSGEIVASETGSVELATGGSRVRVAVPDNVRISVRAPADISAIKPGEFIGTTAAPRADGTLVASEVHIFPESMRGTGEGHRPMDAANTMTNATVSNVASAAPRNTMTNATVSNVAAGGGERTLMLTYKGGEKTVVVPPDVPVMTTEQGDRTLLVQGAKVVVYATPKPDGTLVAERVSVGQGGFAPQI